MEPYLHQIKRLSWFLLISISFNAFFIAILMFLFFQEKPEPFFTQSYALLSESQGVVADQELKQAIEELKGQTVDELLVKLSDKTLVEHGFTVGDISLGILSGFYQFDLERALSRPLKKKAVAYGTKGETVYLFTDLSEQDFLRLETFIRQEKWPFSSQGLFKLLKNPMFMNDSSLKETFYHTKEFIEVERLVSTRQKKFPKERILSLILSGERGKLAAFYEIKKSSFDISEKPRRLFLLDWVHQGASEAAQILYETDLEFSLKKLDDATTLKILKLLETNETALKDFSEKLLRLPRSEAVKRAAQAYLPKVDTLSGSLSEPPKVLAKPTLTQLPKQVYPEGIYIVQPNDSLWKISKKLNVSIEILKAMNGLTSDQLKPGRPLRIPAANQRRP